MNAPAPRIEIGGARLRAAVVPELAMVCVSLEHDGEEVVALPNTLEAYGERGLATGIPLLFPWANRLGGTSYPGPAGVVDLEPGRRLLQFDGPLPIHGVIPSLIPFRVVEAGAHAVEAEFDSVSTPQLLEVFPFPLRLTVRADISGSTLTIATTLAATSDVPVPISFGYHPYFRLPGSPRDRWTLDVSAGRRLVLDARKVPTGATEPVTFAGEPLAGRSLDDGFTDLGPAPELAVSDARTRITVRLEEGYPYAQVYAPGDADLIALEPMTAAADALRGDGGLRYARRGRPFTSRFSIAVDEL